MKGEVLFLEFDKIYLAYVWVNIKNVNDIHPGILLVEKPFDGNIKNLKYHNYYLYINLNGIIKSINIKFVETLKSRNKFNAHALLKKYNDYKMIDKNKKLKVLNEDYLNV